MASVYQFVLEDADGVQGTEVWEHGERAEARAEAMRQRKNLVMLEFEYSDSSLVESFLPGHNLDGTVEETVAVGLRLTELAVMPGVGSFSGSFDERVERFIDNLDAVAAQDGLEITETVTHRDPTVIFPEEGDT